MEQTDLMEKLRLIGNIIECFYEELLEKDQEILKLQNQLKIQEVLQSVNVKISDLEVKIDGWGDSQVLTNKLDNLGSVLEEIKNQLSAKKSEDGLSVVKKLSNLQGDSICNTNGIKISGSPVEKTTKSKVLKNDSEPVDRC